MKFSTKKKPITISVGKEGAFMYERSIDAYVSKNGIWAIHRSVSSLKEGFCVTHIPSGYNINRRGQFKTIKAAKRAARVLNPIAKWKKCVQRDAKGFVHLPESIARKARKALDLAFKKSNQIIPSRESDNKESI